MESRFRRLIARLVICSSRATGPHAGSVESSLSSCLRLARSISTCSIFAPDCANDRSNLLTGLGGKAGVRSTFGAHQELLPRDRLYRDGIASGGRPP